MTAIVQRSFAGGEVSPAMYARVDVVKYATGLRKCENFIVRKWGGISDRPGSQFVAETNDPSREVRLVRFVFNDAQTYVLEFGHLYMRVHRLGAQLREASVAISTTSAANPVVVTTTGAHGYTTGDEVYLSGIAGMTELNNRQFKITVTGGSTFSLQYMDGTTNVDGSGWSAGSGGTSEKAYQIVTPYDESDLQELQYIQSADVITIVHPNYAPQELTRTGDTAWSLDPIAFEPEIARPENAAGVAGGAGANEYRYKVTAIQEESFNESLSGLEASDAITSTSQTNPVRVNAPGHPYADGDTVLIEGVSGMTEINDREFVVVFIDASNYDLLGEDGSGYPSAGTGGTAKRTFIKIASAAAPTTGSPHALSWDAVAGAVDYSIYKELNGVYGFIGTAAGTDFNDTGIPADTTVQPPQLKNPFRVAGEYPSAVAYYQQRRGFANADDFPEKIWFSATGDFANFSTRSPVQDDDAVIFQLRGRQVNEVRHMLDLGKLVIFTSGGEFEISGDAAGTLTPTGINARQQSYYGASERAPLVIGNTALFVQERGNVVRDFSFQFTSDRFQGNDLTIFAAHLFEDFTVRDWAYQQIPNSVVWVARSDGTLLGLTYIPAHEIWGWHRHDFQSDVVEQVVSVPEGDEDALYLVIRRTLTGLASLGGSSRRYIERLASRRIIDEDDLVLVDSSLSFDGRHTGAITMTLTGSGWTPVDTLTLTASSAYFDSGDVGNQIFLRDSAGNLVRFNIEGFTSTTIVTGKPDRNVPASLQATAAASWAEAVDQIGGLWHLEGEGLAITGDSLVAANPLNSDYTIVTVTDGIATLDRHYAVIHAGLPYLPEMETLDIDTAQGETMMDKRKGIGRLTVAVEDTRGIWAGPDSNRIYEKKIADAEDYDDPPALQTGNIDLSITGEWNPSGRIVIQRLDPVPATILAVAPAGYVPLRG